jgi:hypothetical protein
MRKIDLKLILLEKGKALLCPNGKSQSGRFQRPTMKEGKLKKSLFVAQNIFSTILKLTSLQIENSPFLPTAGRLRHSICHRSASLRMVPEKILIHTQGLPFQFF